MIFLKFIPEFLESEVNFTVTKSGLEGQLLGVTIQNEQPELEQQKSKLLKQEEDFKVQLAALEKELLETLATSEGDILENVKLIESLTQTKETSKGISDALQDVAYMLKRLKRSNKYRFSNAKTRLLVGLQGEAHRRAARRPAPEAEGAPRRRARQRQA